MRLATFCLYACALLPLSARADPVTVSFSAIVSRTSADYAPLGSVITGSFVFDLDPSSYQTLVPPGESNALQYTYSGDPYGMRIQFAGASPDLSLGGDAVGVFDGFPYGSEPIDMLTFNTKRNGITYSLSLEWAADSFIGTALPSLDWIASGWNSAYITVFDEWSFKTDVVGRVTSVSVAPVPEPATTAMLLLGLGAVCARARRRSGPASSRQ